MEQDYWLNFWNENKIIQESNPQQQVGRTINKAPIDDERWDKTLNEIEKIIKLSENDNLLDLCCGNGLISIPFSKKCKTVTSVDISSVLINNIDNKNINNIKTILCNIIDTELPENSFDKVILYFALQHFSVKDTVVILDKIHKWLKPGGICLIGDIPDTDNLWNFFNTKEREFAFFESIINEKPILGTWFKKDFLIKLANYSNFKSAEIVNQPEFMINSWYRFDLVLYN